MNHFNFVADEFAAADYAPIFYTILLILHPITKGKDINILVYLRHTR